MSYKIAVCKFELFFGSPVKLSFCPYATLVLIPRNVVANSSQLQNVNSLLDVLIN